MDIFIISDNHFGHKNILKFKRPDNTLLRPEFSSVKEMNEYMIEKWNSVVKENDTVIHVGDVALNSNDDNIDKLIKQLNGKIHLILGNHDDILDYIVHFETIRSTVKFSNIRQPLIFSHYPVHPNFFEFNKNYLNVHGHIHEKSMNDERYVNVSVERCKYTPIHIDEIMDRTFKD